MNSTDIRTLRIFYRRLKSVLEIERPKNNHESLLFPFFEMKANTRYRLLLKASISTQAESRSVIQILLDEKCISPSQELDQFHITAKGVWVLEDIDRVLTMDQLLTYLNGKYFSVGGKISAKLSEREKIVILLFLGLRAFSPDACIDVRPDDSVLKALEEAARKCYSVLANIGSVSELKIDEVFKRKGIEHPVSNLIRHTDSLPRKTKGMFTALRSQKYYLDVSKDREIDAHKISYLLALLCNGKEGIGHLDDLGDIMESMSIDYSIYVFEDSSKSFSSPVYNHVMREAIEEMRFR